MSMSMPAYNALRDYNYLSEDSRDDGFESDFLASPLREPVDSVLSPGYDYRLERDSMLDAFTHNEISAQANRPWPAVGTFFRPASPAASPMRLEHTMDGFSPLPLPPRQLPALEAPKQSPKKGRSRKAPARFAAPAPAPVSEWDDLDDAGYMSPTSTSSAPTSPSTESSKDRNKKAAREYRIREKKRKLDLEDRCLFLEQEVARLMALLKTKKC